MKAMVLAAGLGTRLRPFSLQRPKPLFPVLDTPLLTHTLTQLRRNGVEGIVVNAHHLRGQIKAMLQGQGDVLVQMEDLELGTGGGLRLAQSHFGEAPFLAVNGDIAHDFDLAAAYRTHCASGAEVTMVLHDCPRFNNVRVDGEGRITGFVTDHGVCSKRSNNHGISGHRVPQVAAHPEDISFARADKLPSSAISGTAGEGERLLAFTGVQVINPAVLSLIPAGVFYNIIDCYEALLKSGDTIQALVVSGHFWTDMGTPADYLRLHEDILLQGRLPGFFPRHGDSPFYLGKDAKVGAGVSFQDWVAIGQGTTIGAGASLARVVVWDGARVAPGSILTDTIISGGY